jgi:hypothetical protein
LAYSSRYAGSTPAASTHPFATYFLKKPATFASRPDYWLRWQSDRFRPKTEWSGQRVWPQYLIPVLAGKTFAVDGDIMLTLTSNGVTYRYYYTSPEALSTWLEWLQRQTAISQAA